MNDHFKIAHWTSYSNPGLCILFNIYGELWWAEFIIKQVITDVGGEWSWWLPISVHDGMGVNVSECLRGIIPFIPRKTSSSGVQNTQTLSDALSPVRWCSIHETLKLREYSKIPPTKHYISEEALSLQRDGSESGSVTKLIALCMVIAAGMHERKWSTARPCSKFIFFGTAVNWVYSIGIRWKHPMKLPNCSVSDFLQKSPLLMNLVKAHTCLLIVVSCAWPMGT
jgi:hypothetical protein